MKFLQIIIDKINDTICPFCNIKLTSIENQMDLLFSNYIDLHKCNICNLQCAKTIKNSYNKINKITYWKYDSYILSFYWNDVDALDAVGFDMYDEFNERIFDIGFKYKEGLTIELRDTHDSFEKDFSNFFSKEIYNLNTIEDFQSLCDKIIKQEVFK